MRAILSGKASAVVTGTFGRVRVLWGRFFPVVRRIRINPRVAVACISFATFGLLLTRVSPESQAGKIPQIAAVVLADAADPQALSAKQQPEKPKGVSAVDARMIDAPSQISSSCEEQAWPYVTASCLTVADPVPHQTPPEAGVAEAAATSSDAAATRAQAIPASTSNAQAMITPDTPVSVDSDKPSRREVAKRRHQENRRHARAERRRHVARAAGVPQDVVFTRPWSSNTPW
jgi:hypothetical protein